MVFLGCGKFARADKSYALEPLRGEERGDGQRTRVWVEGVATPIVASRTERTILHDMGQDAAAEAPIVAMPSTSPPAWARRPTPAGSTSAISVDGPGACWPRRPARSTSTTEVAEPYDYGVRPARPG